MTDSRAHVYFDAPPPPLSCNRSQAVTVVGVRGTEDAETHAECRDSAEALVHSSPSRLPGSLDNKLAVIVQAYMRHMQLHTVT